MNKEIWKEIKYYEGFYKVSNKGNVYSSTSNKELSKLKSNGSYYRVALCNKGKVKLIIIGRLVAQAFLGLDISNRKIFVCHKNDNGLNNNVSNLFLGTPKDNMQDMIKKGRNVTTPGIKNGMAILIEEDIIKIRTLYKNGMKQFKIAELFNISRPTINGIIHNKLWKHI